MAKRDGVQPSCNDRKVNPLEKEIRLSLCPFPPHNIRASKLMYQRLTDMRKKQHIMDFHVSLQ